MTKRQLNALTEPGFYGTGERTLYLRIGPTGAKSWIQRITIEGKRCDLGLGPLDLVTLADAKGKALKNRVKVYQGEDPRGERAKAGPASKAPTFHEAVAQTFAVLRPRWKTEKQGQQWMSRVQTFAMPTLGNKPVDRITRQDVIEIVAPVLTEKPSVGRRLRMHLRDIFGWAEAHGHLTENVAGPGINAALPRVNGNGSHHRALPHQEVGAALARVDSLGARLATRLCFRFLVLTACRSGEARGAQWREVDMERAVWTVPSERTKTGNPHRVPLSPAALAVLEKARTLDDGNGLIFPGRVGTPLNDVTLSEILSSLGIQARATVHGFRSSFRDWCAETGVAREVAEAALAHVVGGTEGAYFRSDLLARRREVMAQWAAYLG